MPKQKLDLVDGAFEAARENAIDLRQRKVSLILSPVAMMPGVLMMLFGFGVIHPASATVHPPLLLLAAFGATVFLGGLAAFLQGLGLAPPSWLNRLLGLAVFSGMSAPFIWLLFLNQHIPESTKLLLKTIFGVIILFFMLFAFARFIPGVRVIASKGARTIERSKNGWEDD